MTLVSKWLIELEFDGSKYFGWQKQAKLNTIQGTLENVLSKIASHNITTYAAGRTDRGVHAKNLTIHFETTTERPAEIWLKALNALLPNDIRCLSINRTQKDFHARHSATARSYQYRICIQKNHQPVQERMYSWWFPYEIKIPNIELALESFHGTHDFKGYRGRDCQATTTIKTIYESNLVVKQDFLLINFTGNAFLHHMVRNMVGATMLIAQSRKDLTWLMETLEHQTRHPEVPMAPAHGLWFMKAHYSSTIARQ